MPTSSSWVPASPARRHVRGRRRRPVGGAARPGERGEPRGPGVVELRRPVPRRQPRTAPDGHLRLLRARLAGLGGHRRLGPPHRTRRQPRPRPLGAQVGPGLRRVGGRREAGLAEAAWASRSSPSSGGPSVATAPAAATATRCLGSTSRGAPAPVWSRRSSARCASTSRPGGCSTGPATGSTSSCAPTVRSPGCAAWCSRRTGPPPGVSSNREVVGEFEYGGQAVVVTSGGIGGNHDLVRANWPERLGSPPADLLTGVPAYVDGRMLAIPEAAGGLVVNRDRMWHYVEGVRNWNPDLAGARHPHPARARLDVVRRAGQPAARPVPSRLQHLGTLNHPRHTGFDHSWFILNRSLDRQGVRPLGVRAESRPHREALPRGDPPAGHQGHPSVQAFLDHGEDWLTAATIGELVGKINALTPEAPPLDPAFIERQVVERDRQVENRYTKDAQIAAIRVARRTAATRSPSGPTRSPHPRPEVRAAGGGAAAGAVAQDARRACTPTCPAGCSGRRASRCPGCTPRGRSPGSAAVGCTATARSRERSSGAASSRAGPRAEPPRRPCERGHRSRGASRCGGGHRERREARRRHPRWCRCGDTATSAATGWRARCRSPARSSPRSRCPSWSTGSPAARR